MHTVGIMHTFAVRLPPSYQLLFCGLLFCSLSLKDLWNRKKELKPVVELFHRNVEVVGKRNIRDYTIQGASQKSTNKCYACLAASLKFAAAGAKEDFLNIAGGGKIKFNSAVQKSAVTLSFQQF